MTEPVYPLGYQISLNLAPHSHSEVPFFVAPGNREHAWQHLYCTCIVTIACGSTGVYWRPVYTVLEGHFELIVGNARHIRNVPGARLT